MSHTKDSNGDKFQSFKMSQTLLQHNSFLHYLKLCQEAVSFCLEHNEHTDGQLRAGLWWRSGLEKFLWTFWYFCPPWKLVTTEMHRNGLNSSWLQPLFFEKHKTTNLKEQLNILGNRLSAVLSRVKNLHTGGFFLFVRLVCMSIYFFKLFFQDYFHTYHLAKKLSD